MFSKLKEKLHKWTKKVSENNEEIIEESAKTKEEKKKTKKKSEKENHIKPKKTVEKTQETPKKEKIKEKKKLNLFSKKKIITEKEFEKYSEDLEMILLENNVALEVTDKILEKLKENIVGKGLDKKQIEEKIKQNLKQTISEVLLEPPDIIKEIKEKEGPYIIIFCGINGTGKTTQISKIANLLKKNKISSIFAAGDTFRAAAVEQLKEHGKKLDIKVISHEYNSDPASVGYDAIKYAKKNNIKTVLIDTAGRIHTATNLLKEMEKIKRVCKPDKTIFVGESITGNDAVDQVKAFDETIGIDGIILSKADIDEKGGTALSVGYITKKPILFLGTGQEYNDLEKFDKEKFMEKLGLN